MASTNHDPVVAVDDPPFVVREDALTAPEQPCEILIVAFPGVQRFIESGRTTADLWAASAIRSEISHSVVTALNEASVDGCELIFPSQAKPKSRLGVPNRIVIKCEPERGKDLAKIAVEAARKHWTKLLEQVGSGGDSWATQRNIVIWVVGSGDTYQDAWVNAQNALVARRRIRDFDAQLRASPRGACRSCGIAPAVATPQGLDHWMRSNEMLCPVCLTKRWRRKDSYFPFPSTSTVAAAPYAKMVAASNDDNVKTTSKKLAALIQDQRDTRGSFKGIRGLERFNNEVLAHDGQWMFPENWSRPSGDNDTTAQRESPEGREAASALSKAVGSQPATYLAILAQDADKLGQYLSKKPSIGGHQAVSNLLCDAGDAQIRALEDEVILGTVIYAGGDDLLAFVPAKTALQAAFTAQEIFRNTFLLGAVNPSNEAAAITAQQIFREKTVLQASSAVVFFHRSYPLSAAMRIAREALLQAKLEGRDRVSVVVVRRGGERARVVLPWMQAGKCPIRTLDELVKMFSNDEGALSPRCVNTVANEVRGLSELSDKAKLLEIKRITRRHGDTSGDGADAIYGLFKAAQAPTALVEAMTIARFLSQEGR